MKKMILMFAVMTSVTGCFFPMEDLPLEDDAESPTVKPDAAPAPSPDATPTVEVDAEPIETPDATAPEVPDAGTPECDASVPVPPDAAPVPPPDAAPAIPDAACPCGDAGDCSDSYSWTSDACAAGTCAYMLTDCGGMQVRPSESAVTCMFWGGFGTSEPAPSLGSFAPEGLATGPAGGLWKAAPASACSVICYSSGGNRVALDIQTEWSGATSSLTHAQYDGVTKGTFDGLHME